MLPHERQKATQRVLSPDEEWSEAKIERLRAALHPMQRDAVDDPGRRVSMIVGRGGGKTTALRVRAITKCLRTRKAKVVYFAKTRHHAKDLVWNPLKDMLEELGFEFGVDVLFNETELRCTFTKTGSIYQLSGAEDLAGIEKWRGQSFNEVQIDEGASHKAELLDVLLFRIVGPRLGDRDGCIVMTGTPGHIMIGTFYDVTRTGSDLHRRYSARATVEPRTWSSHHWTLKDVAELPDAERRHAPLVRLWSEALIEKGQNQWSDDNPVWKREYLAIWAADGTTTIFQYVPRLEDGTPWNEWDPPRLSVGGVELAELPLGDDGKPRGDWLYALTTDHGAKDPFACNVFAASPSDKLRRIFHVYGYELQGMYARRIAILLLGPEVETSLDAAHARPGGVIGALGEWPTGMESDVAQLGQNILDELSQVYGIKFLPAEQKGKLAGIEMVNSDLVDGRLKILKGSKLAEQLSELQWVRDEYGFPKENKAQANHSTDCLIYGRKLLARLFDAAGDAPALKLRRDSLVDPLRLPEFVPDGEFDVLFDV